MHTIAKCFSRSSLSLPPLIHQNGVLTIHSVLSRKVITFYLALVWEQQHSSMEHTCRQPQLHIEVIFEVRADEPEKTPAVGQYSYI